MNETLKCIRNRFEKCIVETCCDLAYMITKHPVITGFAVGCVTLTVKAAFAKQPNEKESSKESES